jgi:hypothetical protein
MNDENLGDVNGSVVGYLGYFPRGTRKIHEKYDLEEPMP